MADEKEDVGAPEPSPLDLFAQTLVTSGTIVPDDIEVLGKAVEVELKGVYSDLLSDSEREPLARIESISEKVIAKVAPDILSMRASLMKNSRFLNVMSDSAAIASLAFMGALASGFSARKPFRELCMASVLMDLPLADLLPDLLRQMYLDPSALSEEVQQEIRNHPQKSWQLVMKRMKQSVNETILDLVATHHELYDGSGFPKKIRNGTLTPLSRILAFGVDIHSQLKGCLLKGETVSLAELLRKELQTPEASARHSPLLLRAIVEYFGVKA
jgi:hypothetical protein